MCYRARSNLEKDVKGDLFAESHGILARGRNFTPRPKYGMYIELIISGRTKYTQQENKFLNLVPLNCN
jgi:hypothetical protein